MNSPWVLARGAGLGSLENNSLPRPCSYGKGGRDAHDEEELYFHCEWSMPGAGGWVWHHPILASPSCLSLPPLQPRTPFFSPCISLSALLVKVPTRRTFLDPLSCGDPLQAVHLFAKELDAKSVTLEKSLGAGKPGSRAAFLIASPPDHTHYKLCPVPPKQAVMPTFVPAFPRSPCSTPSWSSSSSREVPPDCLPDPILPVPIL